MAAPLTGLLSQPAQAQESWPSRSITLIAPNSPGGPADTLARSVMNSMSRELGVSVVVDNKPGAAGKIGMLAAMRAPRDGYTIAVTSITAMCSLPVFSSQAGYDPLKDFDPLTLAVRTPSVLVMHPSVPVRNMKELVAYVKARPRELNYASFGEKSSSHLAFENLSRLLDLEVTHVPFRSESDGRTALVSGQVQLMGTSAASKPFIDSGRLIALGQSSAGRWSAMPNVPSLRESGLTALASYEYEPWLGFSVATGVPPAVRERLTMALRNALRSAEANQLQTLGYRVVASTPAEMREAVVADIAEYKVLARSGRVKPE
ncbi:MAG: Bug family tripartite tricarboxylate transporter substrate binding protein [Polaromonas sp.]